MEEHRYRQIVRASAWYDVVIAAGFLTPWSFAWVYGKFSLANQLLGGAALDPFAPLPALFVCMLGAVVMCWAALRLTDTRANLVRYGRFDAAMRLQAALWMLWAYQETKAPLLFVFLLPECLFCALECLPLATPRPQPA
ncbi:MAG: hypothetical protein JO002_08135 [Burkholderiaceae bacterium]|nr:hypothetical protein [Burkholderiaceae bacterium]